VAHRSDLLRALLLTADSARIPLHAGRTVEKAENALHGARLHLAEGAAIDGAAAVGADGIHSTIRQTILGDGNPIYGGHALYRALIPFDKVPLSIAADCVTLWLYPGGHAVHYAVSNWRHCNIVVALESPWSQGGWGEPASKSEVMVGFIDASDPLAELLACVPAWLKWAACDRPPTDSWSSRNIALLGDAVHPSLPYLAQGAAMAIEDACVLAKCVAVNSSIAAAFADFASQRQPRTAHIQREARRLGKLYHASGLLALARNTVLRCAGPEHALERNRWIYEWKP
jgi:salicylate hydroxylase